MAVKMVEKTLWFEVYSNLKETAFTAVKRRKVLNEVCERGTICQ